MTVLNLWHFECRAIYIYISLSFWWIRSTLQRGWFDPWLNCEHRNRFGVQCSGHGNFSIANRILDNFLWCCLCFNFDANSVRHRQMENDRAPLSPHIHFVCDKWHIYQLGTLCLCQQHTIWIYCCQQLLSRSYVDFEWNSTQIIFANWIEMCTDSVLRKLYVFFFSFCCFIFYFIFFIFLVGLPFQRNEHTSVGVQCICGANQTDSGNVCRMFWLVLI